jgi:hypothetical protein
MVPLEIRFNGTKGMNPSGIASLTDGNWTGLPALVCAKGLHKAERLGQHSQRAAGAENQ